MFAALLPRFLIPGILGLALVGTHQSAASACGCACCSMDMGGMAMTMPATTAKPEMSMAMADEKGGKPPAPAVENYGGQKTCPVSGKALGSMGKPIEVKVKGDSFYVCCQACVTKANANFDVYLAKVQKEKKGNAAP